MTLLHLVVLGTLFLLLPGCSNPLGWGAINTLGSLDSSPSSPTIYLRANGNDTTGAVSDSSHPFLTAQAAVNAAITYNQNVTIDVGDASSILPSHNFGNVVVAQDFGQNVKWSGVSTSEGTPLLIPAPANDPLEAQIKLMGFQCFIFKAVAVF
jgi:hypothetical protein